MTNITNISAAARNKAVVAAMNADQALADKACLALDLLCDPDLADVPAGGIVKMLRGASAHQVRASASRYGAPATRSDGNSGAAGWARATAAANAHYGL